jgi:hypothetical protein
LVGIPDEEHVTNDVVKEVLARGMARHTHVGAVRRIPTPRDDYVDDAVKVVISDLPK